MISSRTVVASVMRLTSSSDNSPARVPARPAVAHRRAIGRRAGDVRPHRLGRRRADRPRLRAGRQGEAASVALGVALDRRRRMARRCARIGRASIAIRFARGVWSTSARSTRRFDCSVETWETPIFLSPVGGHRTYNPEGRAGDRARREGEEASAGAVDGDDDLGRGRERGARRAGVVPALSARRLGPDAAAAQARRSGRLSGARVHRRSARRPQHGAVQSRVPAQPAAVRRVSPQRPAVDRPAQPADVECAVAVQPRRAARDRLADLGLRQAAARTRPA